MPKYDSLEEYIETFKTEAKNCYIDLGNIIKNIKLDIKEKLFAGQVAYYVEDTLRSTFHSSPVIVMSFFKDHVNIFANANERYQSQLSTHKFTKKNTLQIFYGNAIDSNILTNLFKDSLQ